MSNPVTFYTLGNMEKAKITAVTNTATGFPKENMVDFNPDTYWKQSGNAIHVIDVNLGAAKLGDLIVLLINDFTSNHSGKSIDVLTDDNDDGNYTATTSQFLEPMPNSRTQQIWTLPLDTPPTKQYWRFEIDLAGLGTNAPFLAGLFICRKYTITQGSVRPEPALETYENRATNTAGSRSFVSAINKNKTEAFQRTYQLLTADMDTLQDVFNDSAGSLFPLILQEGTTDADARFVRFADNTLNRNQIDYQLYRPTVTFVTQPYIPDGDSY